MALTHRRCIWCGDKLTGRQRTYCSRQCTLSKVAPKAWAVRKQKPTKPHGTPAAWRKHYRDGEKPCEACRLAQTFYSQDLRAARRRAA
jgi:hypothetical protein